MQLQASWSKECVCEAFRKVFYSIGQAATLEGFVALLWLQHLQVALLWLQHGNTCTTLAATLNRYNAVWQCSWIVQE